MRRPRVAGPCIAGLLLTSLLCAGPALADPRTVLVVAEEGPGRLRLEAEVRSLGFVPEAVSVEAPLTMEQLEALAREHDAMAAVHIAPSSVGATVWVVDRVTGKVLLRHVEAPSGDEDAQALVAVRAAELLRASLLEVREEHESRGEVAADEAVEHLVAPEPEPPVPEPRAPEPSPPEPSILHLSVGAALGGTVDGVGVLGRVTVGASVRLHRFVGLSLSVEMPLRPATVRGVEGTADLQVGALVLLARLPLWPAGSRLDAHVGAGAVLAYFRSSGRAAAPFGSREDRLVRVAPTLELGASVHLGARLAIGATLRAAYYPDGVDVRFAGREVASYGQPELFGQLLLSAGLD